MIEFHLHVLVNKVDEVVNICVIFITFNMKYLSPRVCTEACRKVRVKFQRELEWRHNVYSVYDYFRLED